MKPQPISQINKEKLIFIAVSAVLAGCFYPLLSTQPAALIPGLMLTSMGGPSPVDADKEAARLADVNGVLNNGTRNNPFQPVDAPRKPPEPPGGDKNSGTIKLIPEGPLDPDRNRDTAVPAPKPPEGPRPLPHFDFSAVMTMNGKTYGLLKARESGRTLRVEEGGGLDGLKYTVTKVERQAIWVVDEANHVFVARDLTFETRPQYDLIAR